MNQTRNKTGITFEKSICDSKGWLHKSVSPRINWFGSGRSNWDKMKEINLDPTKFIPNIEKSNLEKYDAITNNGDKVEIKKYSSSKLLNWVLYSEPIFKVATRSSMGRVIEIFGGGDYDKSIIEYNKFVEGVIDNIGVDILDGITKSNIGVQLEDEFIHQDDLEYCWMNVSGWRGYNRLSIFVKIK